MKLDDVSWRILRGLSTSPKTPQTLSRVFGIPIAECWNRVHLLESLGLVRVVLMFVSHDGRFLKFYQTGDETVDVVIGETAEAVFEPA